MTQIKFRAWDNNSKQWVTGWYLCDDGNIYAGGRDLEDGIAASQIKLAQFTGLHDKNGKEIYEGDIVDEFRTSRGFPEGRHITRVIEWNNDMTLDDAYGCTAVGFNMFGGELEVIGNIYDNPELLDRAAA